MNFYAISSLVASTFCFILSCIVYLKSEGKVERRLFATVVFLVGIWTLFPFVTSQTPGHHEALDWARFVYVPALFVPPSFFQFMLHTMRISHEHRERLILKVCYTLACFFLLFITRPIFIKGVIVNAPYSAVKPGFLYYLFVVYFAYIYFHTSHRLLRLYHHSTGLFQEHLKYVGVAFSIGVVGGVVHFASAFGIPEIVPHDILIMAYVGILAFAIVRYRLMNINVAITRTAVFGVVYAMVLGLPLAGALAWQTRLEQALGAKWWVWLWVVCAFLATAAHYLNLYLQSKAEAQLLWEQRRYQATLLHASHGMTQVRELKRLLNLIVHVITKAVGVAHASVYLEDPKEGAYVLSAYRYKRQIGSLERLSKDDPLLIRWLREEQEPLVLDELKAKFSETASSNGRGQEQTDFLSQLQALQASVVIPSFMQDQLIGFLVLGEKRDGRMFTTEDLDVFSTLANQAALAIENARFFDELKANEAFMIQAEKMASLGQLASGMAHEIHNPLAIISGEAQLYLERAKGGDGEIGTLLRSIIEECFRAADITRRILRFAKPGKAEGAPVDLRAVVEESLQLASYQVRLERIERRLDIPPDLPKVKGNQNQLQEVVLNLILNACQAMGERGGEIAVSAKPVDGEVELNVSDNGLGIPRAKLSRIFDPFYTTKSGGTGLGLFVSHRIIRAHNGTIAVQSAEGHGTTFTIHLPIFHESAAQVS